MAENGIIEWHRDSVWNHAYVFLYIAYQQNTSVNTGKHVLISSSLALVFYRNFEILNNYQISTLTESIYNTDTYAFYPTVIKLWPLLLTWINFNPNMHK